MAISNENWRFSRNNLHAQEIDLEHIVHQAQVRWLRASEILEILQNYKKYNFKLSPVPPNKPSSGSLYLFDRNVLRYFRKDGHNWRKKNDGKTVREAHERLKIESVDMLHCYYAHGEDNPNFQRRSFWMLDGAFEHIVLVHYLEVTQDSRPGISSFSCDSSTEGTLPPSSNNDQSILSPEAFTPSLRPHALVLSPGTSEAEVNGPSSSNFIEVASSSFSLVLEEESMESSKGKFMVDVKGSTNQPSLSDQLSERTSTEDLATDMQKTMIDRSVCMSNPEDGFVKGPPIDRSQPTAGFSRENVKALHSYRAQASTSKSGVGDEQNGPPQMTKKLEKVEMSDTHLNLDPYPSLPSVTQVSNSTVQKGELFPRNVPEDQENGGAIQARKMQHLINHEGHSPNWAEVLEMCDQNASVDFLLNPEKGLPRSSAEITQVGMPPSLKAILQVLSANRPPQTNLEAQLRAVTAKNALRTAAEEHRRGTLQVPEEKPFSGVAFVSQQVPCNSQDEGSTGLAAMEHHFRAMNYENGLHQGLQQHKQLEQCDNSIRDGSYFTKKEPWEENWLQNEISSLGILARNDATTHLSSSHISMQPDNGNSMPYTHLNKQDSFGRWWNDLAYENGGSPLFTGPSESGSDWVATLEEEISKKENCDGTQQRWMDLGLNVHISHLQKFTIQDFSPDWSFAFEESKVLINGAFLKPATSPDHCFWSCMFGEVEVPAEVVNDGVLRCKAPPHCPGRVPFYVTCGNRLACSEIREFEFRAKCDVYTQATKLSSVAGNMNCYQEESIFQIRLARMLYSNLEDPGVSIFQRDEPSNVSGLYDTNSCEEWDSLEKIVDLSSSAIDCKEQLLQMLLKQKLQDWLLSKVNEEERCAPVLNGQGQGFLHLVAALNYDWAISPILAAGINVNFRDQRGWTALHYAAAYGRENAVLALLAAGAAAGPVTDPTPQYRGGQTPADLASANGHGGIAAFLAETSLTMHLKSLTIKEQSERQIFAVSADWEGENAVQSVTNKGPLEAVETECDDQSSLRQSLCAVRNAAQTAALIRATFRQHSFQQREEASSRLLDEHGMSQSQVKGLVAALKVQKIFQGNSTKRESAATKIQCQFRGWKGRKEFLDLRQQVIKIQAHIRGHQVRRKYKKILWSVGVVEKAILRWRRKRTGLRNFRAETNDPGNMMNGEENSDDDFLKEGRKQKELAIEKAVNRVQSMIKSSTARAQYLRLLEGSHRTTQDLHGGAKEAYDESSLQQQGDFDMCTDVGLESDLRYRLAARTSLYI